MANEQEELFNQIMGDMKKKWGWMLALGILMLVLGIAGLGMEFALTITTVLFFGILFIIGGVAQLVDAFRYQGWKSKLGNILIAILYILAGIVMIWDPVMASATITLVIAWALVAIGVVRLYMAFQMKGIKGWGLTLLGGVAAIVLGVLIMIDWPISGLWVIGLFVAIELIFNGWSLIFIALAARKMIKSVDTP